MKNDAHQRARERLDQRLAPLKPIDRFRAPPKGWVRALRDALGMSGVQFARRLGVRPPTVVALKASEESGAIQLKTLRRAAEALDCTLVYALVPNDSLEGTVCARARKIALRALGRVAHTMKLEAQETQDSATEARIDAYIRDNVKERDLWDDRD
jgi:predicted DNA-binding mobile mystery protein A